MDNKIWKIREDEKICCLDIDGILNNYPKCWVDFINRSTSSDYKNLNEAKADIAYDDYRNLKELYRTCGIKEALLPTPYAAELTKKLKEMGYTIVIMTARPAHKYPTLYTQTINWLKANDILFDSIFFEEKNKHSKILSKLPHINFMVEDNSYIANQISKWGYKVFLLKNQYNEGLELGENVIPIDKLEDIIKTLQ